MTLFKIYLYGLLFLSLSIYYVTNTLIEEPYMDEIFHFPQAMKYYNGSFDEWDPKITTPPGLYIMSVAIVYPASKITGLNMGKISCFRLVNILFTSGSFYVAYKLLINFHKGIDERMLLLSAFNIAMLPVLYFFNFLYYTDCGSLFFVLLMYYYHTKKNFFSSSVAGAISIVFRQTNIVWVFFVAADETVRALLLICSEDFSKKDHTIHLKSFSDIKKLFKSLLNKNLFSVLQKLLKIDFGYIVIALSFVLFVLCNGSIALGDKSSHEVSLHVPQLFYFLAFTLVFASPFLISVQKIKNFVTLALSHKVFIFESWAVCGSCVMFMSHAHPYLLADNTHLTFYIWRRIFAKNIFLSIAIIPAYLYSCWSIVQALSRKDVLFKFLVAFCISLSVVPQKLLEFRYFIIPFTMLRLHLRAESKWQPYLEFLLFGITNLVVLHLFLFKKLPFGNEEKDIRIMW